MAGISWIHNCFVDQYNFMMHFCTCLRLIYFLCFLRNAFYLLLLLFINVNNKENSNNTIKNYNTYVNKYSICHTETFFKQSMRVYLFIVKITRKMININNDDCQYKNVSRFIFNMKCRCLG